MGNYLDFSARLWHIDGMLKQDFTYHTSLKNKISVTVFGGENHTASPALIFVHGFKGFKDWGFGPWMAEQFAAAGFFVITFNFSHNGVGGDPLSFTELEKFAENTFSLELSEVSEIIDAYHGGYFGANPDGRVFLLGHSRGGAIALLTARQRPEVKAVASWAAVSTFDRYSERQKERWREKGVFEVMNQRTKQVMKLNISLLEDLEKYGDDKLNIQKAASGLNRPLLIVHGTEDLAVPYKEAEQMKAWADDELTEFLTVEKAGHTFNAKHPFDGTTPQLDKAVQTTIEFFKKHTE